MRYIDNQDGTITDVTTGLMWFAGNTGNLNWRDSLDACETGTWAGYSDWLLPDRNELQSLVEYARFGPAFDLTAVPIVIEPEDY